MFFFPLRENKNGFLVEARRTIFLSRYPVVWTSANVVVSRLEGETKDRKKKQSRKTHSRKTYIAVARCWNWVDRRRDFLRKPPNEINKLETTESDSVIRTLFSDDISRFFFQRKPQNDMIIINDEEETTFFFF